jgi:hypothetical protein
MNVGAVRYWTTAFPFADMVKNGSAGRRATTGEHWGGSLRPGRTATPPPCSQGSARCGGRMVGQRYPIGRYTVLWEGRAASAFL